MVLAIHLYVIIVMAQDGRYYMLNEQIECKYCNGYGIRFVRVIWDKWERYLWQKSIRPCRSCSGKGYYGK